MLQGVGLLFLGYAIWASAHGQVVPAFAWGLIAALVLPAELVRVIVGKWKGGT